MALVVGVNAQDKTILFFGNSLTAGLGLDPMDAFPALIQKRIDAADLPYKVVNAGLSGETSSGGLRRLDWLMKQKVDVLVIELGANDGLRGIDVGLTRKNIQSMIDKARAANSEIQIVLAGMKVPPNMGPDYGGKFEKIYPELAKQNGVLLIPFLLEGVADRPELNLPDGNHPNIEGQKKVAENVWQFLRRTLKNRI